MGGDATGGVQDIAGNGEFMGGCSGVSERVVKDEAFEMHQPTVDPQRGAGVGEVLAFEKASPDGRARNALVQTGKGYAGVKSRPHQGCHADFRKVASH